MKKFLTSSVLIVALVFQLGGSTQDSSGSDMDHPAAQPNVSKAPGVGTTPNDPLYDQAMAAMGRGGYDEALDKLKNLLQQSGEAAGKEKIMRSMADCHYFLGMKGNRNSLISAVDLYRDVVQRYPDSRDDNIISLYRTAASYAALDFYYEAKREFENLCAKYPDSNYVPESTFRIGEMLYKARKFSESAQKLEDYVRKFPQGEYVKTAYFNLGDCYSQLNQDEAADKWYSDALKKWPDLNTVPEGVLLGIAFHYFRGMKYRDALKLFFFYVNVYPERENNKEILFAIGRSLMELDQIQLSLKVFSLLIERFPKSREAMESAILMANIGVNKPGLKLPAYFCGMENYKEPLKTYDNLLAGASSGDYAEELLFHKGHLLFKSDRHKESFETYNVLLNRFPKSRYREEVMKYFLASAERIVDESYSRGDYLAVSEIYFKSHEQGLITGDNFKVAFAMGESLRRVGLHDEAADVFEKLMKTSVGADDRTKILLAMADVECERRHYENVEKILQRLSSASQEKDQPPKRTGRSKSHAKPSVKAASPDGQTQRHISRILGNVYFKKGLYDKAILAYATALSNGEGIEGLAEIYLKNADCLKAMNSLDAAILSYRKAIEVYNRESRKYAVDILVASYRGIGDCLFEKKEYQEAISMYKQSATYAAGRSEGLWSLYGVGRGYAGLKNQEMADKSLSELKNKGGEGFWSNLADYVQREYDWNEKYDSVGQ
ncbi:MAG TPA: tetratricopeptide repeat protein [Syntrophales bacterium]|nr:tetratricopeptide repeat protein [Syntrophales bacterium]